MSRCRPLLCAGLLLSASCSTSLQFDRANQQLLDLQRESAHAAGPATLQPRFGKLAADALTAGRKADGQLDQAVALYRVAAVASAAAGPPGSATLFPSVDEGQ